MSNELCQGCCHRHTCSQDLEKCCYRITRKKLMVKKMIMGRLIFMDFGKVIKTFNLRKHQCRLNKKFKSEY